MANIEQYLGEIRKSKYCKDMRETFCDALIEANAEGERIEAEVKYIADNIAATNATAEVIAARAGEINLGARLDKIDISKIIIAEDIADTNYKKGSKIDIEFLKNIQMQKFNSVMYKLRNKTEAVTFCHRGDSLTYGYDVVSNDRRENITTYPDGSTHSTTIAGKTYPEAMEEFLKKVYGSDLIKPHINRGRSGDYAKISLSRNNGKHNGDITLLMLGTNDSRATSCPYVGNVEEYLYWMEQIIIQELIWGKPLVLLTSPIVQLQNDFRVDSFSNAVFKLGEKYGIPVIDTQKLLESYSYDIWSDITHFNTKGYSLLGYKLAGCFIGEGLDNHHIVKGGSIIPITYMKSSSINNFITYLNLPLSSVDTPNEYTKENGYYLRYDSINGKATFSFYQEESNLFVIPSMWIESNTTIKLTLDNGIASANSLSSSVYRTNVNNTGNPSEYIITSGDSTIRFNKMYCRNNNIIPFRIANTGWHTLTIEVVSSSGEIPCSLYGLEFVSYDVLNNIFRGKEQILYEFIGTTFPAIGDKILLKDDISKYNQLVISTGGISDKSYYSDISHGFNYLNFRVGTDIVNVRTNNGKFVAEITGEREIKIVQADDNVRYIYAKRNVDI